MLILTRLPGEAVVMESASGEKAKVVVLENRGAQVRLGVIADPSISVDREEIYLRKKEESSRG
ncbi:carbon storage regulator [Marinobacter sp. KMM 10035]|uniref:carbon storage regulator n=1 Tax=Marinobacter sp. KMM 10035 TaxID=3134034 RepID=UPI003979DB2A